MKIKNLINTFIALFVFVGLANAKDTLNIAISPIAPHVIVEGDSIHGFDIELMNQVAQSSDIHINYTQSESLKQLFQSTKSGETQASLAGLSLTDSRMKDYKYSTPYAASSIGIISQSGSDIDIANSLYVLITDYSLSLIHI